MVKKSEIRALRKAQKLEKFENSKQSLINRVVLEKSPKISSEPIDSLMPKSAPHLINIPQKQPIAVFDGSRFSHPVTWCNTRADTIGVWSWGEPRAWSETEFKFDISPSFQDFSNQTWGEIDKYSSESGHRMHHGHELSDLIKEAQIRWFEIKLEEYDSLFRFRLGGKKRAWGFIVQAHFHLVWWERNHQIYPV